MDFLDPKAKRNHLIRLIIGYGLMIVLIGITTFILVYQAYGFDVNRKTGEVIQNGLVFVDSAPDEAAIYFNNQQQQQQTNNRFALPAGDYQMKIQKENYRDWQRKFSLAGGEVERFTYPMLILSNLERQELVAYDAAPSMVTESPDRRWTIVGVGGSLTDFIEYDLNTLPNNSISPQARTFSVANGLLSPGEGAHTLEVVEWSNDNKHFLVKHSWPAGNEFVIISRDEPETSVNINRLLALNPTSITLRDKKFDQWYLYTDAGGVLQSADIKKSVVQVLTGVTAYKSHGSDDILYSQTVNDGKNQRITLLQGKDSHVIKDVVNGGVFLDIARYSSEWYVVVGSTAEQKTYVYRNPVDIVKRNDGTKPTPRSILKTGTEPITQVSFSKNTRFILSQSGQHFEVYDAEYNRTFRYDIAEPFEPGFKIDWMDGHRLMMRSGGNAYIFDYDGENKQKLVTSLPGAPLMFDRDYTVLYTADTSAATAGKFGLNGYELRLDSDK